MSKLNKVFSEVEVPIIDRSGFDLSHEHLTTAKPGQIIPISWVETMPADVHSIGAQMRVTLPPLAVPFMGRVDAAIETFFVPYRILWRGWEAFITKNPGVQTAFGADVPDVVPSVIVDQSTAAISGLASYLGCPVPDGSSPGEVRVSALPFLAYHMIYDHFYRDENNMLPFFPKYAQGGTSDYGITPGLMPITFETATFALNSTNGNIDIPGVANTTQKLGDTRQRCWAKDYFTTATTRPQAGPASSVVFEVDSDLEGEISVASLRSAESLQKWMERNNIAGSDYGSQILVHFGVTPPDAHLNRPVFLGSMRMPVYTTSVEQNTPNSEIEGSTTNPFGSTLGAAAGFSSGMDEGSLVGEFEPKEHGVIMSLFTLIPHAYYGRSVRRELLHRTLSDFPFPEFANMGDQPIYKNELNSGSGNIEFGYNQRYSEMKFQLDRISGELLRNQSLDVYALQRTFSAIDFPELGEEFLTIPQDFLDQISAADVEVSKFGCMIDAFFSHKALRVLPEYSLPSL